MHKSMSSWAPAIAMPSATVRATIALTVAMMALEIGGGLAFGSIAAVSVEFHMGTPAGASDIAALADLFGWTFRDPVSALVGALVIANWSWQLLRATGSVPLDTPDARIAPRERAAPAEQGDGLVDGPLWRLGRGHMGAVACVETASDAQVEDCRAKIAALARCRA